MGKVKVFVHRAKAKDAGKVTVTPAHVERERQIWKKTTAPKGYAFAQHIRRFTNWPDSKKRAYLAHIDENEGRPTKDADEPLFKEGDRVSISKTVGGGRGTIHQAAPSGRFFGVKNGKGEHIGYFHESDLKKNKTKDADPNKTDKAANLASIQKYGFKRLDTGSVSGKRELYMHRNGAFIVHHPDTGHFHGLSTSGVHLDTTKMPHADNPDDYSDYAHGWARSASREKE